MAGQALPFQAARKLILESATPFRRLRSFEKAIGRPGLYIKRDDHMEIALGGNKLRSLEFWLGAAEQSGADVLLVAGGPMSNLCRLTAAAAAMYGYRCVVFHNSVANETSEHKSFLNKLFGAEVRFLGNVTEDQRAKAVKDAADELRCTGYNPYIIGDAILGALGYAVCAHELYQQAKDDAVNLRHVFLSGSMGPTEAGFIFGNAMLGNPFTVHLVSVEYGQAELAARVARIYDDLKISTQLAVPNVEDLPIHYHMDYLGAGYGRPTLEAELALITLARTEGILTEYVYTAKTLAGFAAISKSGCFPADDAVCFLHTGGVPSLFSQFDLFQSMS
ncbi:pyridoxal-phosphate dependent enzyme [Pseudomonas kurunegalensis]|uniref:pyridoxal-phosphate dependent enzyme n=1 Tax=Pseudomonas kurunegalensis TaxID=485880 RepID=UPI002571233F|nr:pyridoxal-phosphate dependent enzyme [Pseudomonas kurunegalensis]WJD65100.1 pyridoxal-phosphate dependent enzyme [Pseudomonas kurunegalensis]